MDSNSREEGEMESRRRARIEAWIDETIRDVTDASSGYDHIDYILDEKISPPSGIEVALQSFTILLQCVLERRAPVLPGLFIRLKPLSDALTLATPSSLEAVKEQWREIEPPSLILYGLNYRNFVRIVEEYHRPLRFSLFAPPIDGVFAYYSESKIADDVAEDFDRAVVVVYMLRDR